MSGTIKIKGVHNVIKRLKQIGDEVDRDVENELYATALDIERDAVAAVPVDTGLLKLSAYSQPLADKNYEAGFNAEYAPYVEFGTGTKVEVPSELNDYANQFRGSGERQVNLPARPFFYPAVKKNEKLLIKRLTKKLKSKKI